MSAPPAPTAERRHNHSLRNQAQAWFDALRLHIAEVEGAEAIAALIKDWQKPEDVMQAQPALVPLFLDMIWRSRKTPGFADLFRTESGEVAEKPTEILALSQKTFDDILIAHLMGTMRLMCKRRQNEWLTVERKKRRGSLSKMPVVGAALRGLGLLSPVKTEILLADYPQKGLYESLKPFLCRREQFALVEVLSTLPTRTVSVLGPLVGVFHSAAPIRALASLDRGTLKVAIEMAEAFVQAVDGPPAEAEGTKAVGPMAPVGIALSEMLRAGASFVTVAAGNRQLAKDAIAKFAPVMRAEIWTIFRDAESLRRIAECPAAIAENLGALTVEINERISIALSEIADGRVASCAMKTLRDGANPETFLSWIQDETYLTAWKQIVHSLNRDVNVPKVGERLGSSHQASVKAVCDRVARVFAEIAAPQKKTA